MSGIYISYRRTDSAAYAGRLFDHLSRHFGPDFVFMDIQGGIARGQDFAVAIDSALNTCDVALVLIGKQWATTTRQDGKLRLDDPNDWVRIETAAALRRNVLVVPVLVDGARLPDPAGLPEELRPLCRRNVCELTDSRWSYDVGELVKDIEKVVRPPERKKIPSLKGNTLRWLAGAVIGLTVMVGLGLFGSNVLRFKLITDSTTDTPNPASPNSGKPASDLASPRRPSAQGGGPRQETRVAGVVAELARFVRTENLITAEVAFRNTGSEPVKFCFGSWKLIDEKTGDRLRLAADGGDVPCYQAKTLAPGTTHVAWAKFKSDSASANKYSVDVEGILNRPFEGLAMSRSPPPTQSVQGGGPRQETRVTGVVAELARFVRTENLTTAEVAFRNTGLEPVKFCFGSWKLIDEKTGEKWRPAADGGDVPCYQAKALAPGTTHVAWAKFKSDSASANKYSVDVEGILNRPFEGLAMTSAN
jgi:hypothetical protein